MAKKPVLPNIGALMGTIKPYGDGETDSGRPAKVLLQSIRLDPGQPRRLLPTALAERVYSGQLSLIQAMQAWAQAVDAPLLPDYLQGEPADAATAAAPATVALQQPSAPEPPSNEVTRRTRSAASAGVPPQRDDVVSAAVALLRQTAGSDAAGAELLSRLQRVRELAASIIHVGLIHPINVIPQADGAYLLETGERRVLAMAWLAACGLSEYERVPALFVSQSASHRARQVTENLSREDLSAVEKARGLWNSRYELSGLPSPDWSELERRAMTPATGETGTGMPRRARKGGPARPPESAVTLGELLEQAGLVPWADVERQLSIGKRYRIWLTQTLELSPQAIALIEQYRLPERATRPLVQLLRDDPAGQVEVLMGMVGGAKQEVRRAERETKGPFGKSEARSQKSDAQSARSQKIDSELIPQDSTLIPHSSSLDSIEMRIKQYLADKVAGAEGHAPAGAPAGERAAAVSGGPLPDETRMVLATRRALQSMRRAMGPRGLNKRALHRIAAQLSADADTVQLAKQIKPLVDALAEEE